MRCLPWLPHHAHSTFGFMASKVYLLTDGPRDDRNIRAAFTTHEAAEAGLRFCGSEPAIVECPLDAPLPEAPADHSLWYFMEDECPSAVRIDAFDHKAVNHVHYDGGVLAIYVWARDEAHAVLDGFERISRFKAGHALPA